MIKFLPSSIRLNLTRLDAVLVGVKQFAHLILAYCSLLFTLVFFVSFDVITDARRGTVRIKNMQIRVDIGASRHRDRVGPIAEIQLGNERNPRFDTMRQRWLFCTSRTFRARHILSDVTKCSAKIIKNRFAIHAARWNVHSMTDCPSFFGVKILKSRRQYII